MDTPLDRFITGEITIPASLDQVWQAWATEAGACAFFARRRRPGRFGRLSCLFLDR
jgi:uncharacterized protein YndB with AHSA1/START domain